MCAVATSITVIINEVGSISFANTNPPCLATHLDPPLPHEGDLPPGFDLDICASFPFLPQEHQPLSPGVQVGPTTLCGILRLFCSVPPSDWTILHFSVSQLSGGSSQQMGARHGPPVAEPRPVEPASQLEHPASENTNCILWGSDIFFLTTTLLQWVETLNSVEHYYPWHFVKSNYDPNGWQNSV